MKTKQNKQNREYVKAARRAATRARNDGRVHYLAIVRDREQAAHVERVTAVRMQAAQDYVLTVKQAGKSATESAAALIDAEQRETIRTIIADAEQAAREQAYRPRALSPAEQAAAALKAAALAEKKAAALQAAKQAAAVERETETIIAPPSAPAGNPVAETILKAAIADAKATYIANLQAIAAELAQDDKRRAQWQRATRAAAACYELAEQTEIQQAAAAVYVTIKHILRRESVKAAAVKQAEQWRREAAAYLSLPARREQLQQAAELAEARAEYAEARAELAREQYDRTRTGRAAAKKAAAPWIRAAKKYHKQAAVLRKCYDELCAENIPFGAELVNEAVLAIREQAAAGRDIKTVYQTKTGRPACVWTQVLSAVQMYIRAQKITPPACIDKTADDKLKTEGARANGTDKETRHNTEREFERSAHSAELAAALNQLKPLDREIVTRLYFNRSSFADIAEDTGKGISTIYRRHAAALLQLAEIMKQAAPV